MASWQTKSSKIVYENPYIVVHEDQVVKPDGTDGIYGYMDSKSHSITVVPVDDEGNTWIVQQERYTLKRTTWEWSPAALKTSLLSTRPPVSF